jgi:hypothetical protein
MVGLLYFACQLDRYSSRRRRGQNRNAFHQDILCVYVRQYEHLVVRVLFFTSIALGKLGGCRTFIDSPRGRWAQ